MGVGVLPHTDNVSLTHTNTRTHAYSQWQENMQFDTRTQQAWNGERNSIIVFFFNATCQGESAALHSARGGGHGGSRAEGWCAGVSASKRGEGREDEFVHLLFGSFIMRNTFICVWSVVSGRRGERGGAPAICQLLAIN